MPALLFAPGCPWHVQHALYPPNVDWCEEKLCSLVVTPFNSWSNAAYLLAAAWMWRRSGEPTHPVLRLFAPAAALTGVASFAYHMSLNYFSQMVDFVGMYVLCMLILMANLQRLGRWPVGPRALAWYGAAVSALTAITAGSLLLGIPAQLYVAALVALIVWSELASQARSRGYFWMSVGAMAVASTLSALDLSRVWCSAGNHWFQPHGAWHVITALALYLAYRHARQAVRG